MEKSFIEFNGTLINTRYIKKIFKTENLYRKANYCDKYYEIRVNIDANQGTHVETYQNEKDRNDRFHELLTLLTPND